MKKFVVCDLDGTLIDTLKGITKAANLMLKYYDYPYQYTEEEVRLFIGNGAKVLFLKLIKKVEFCRDFDEKYTKFQEFYLKNQGSSKPYTNVIQTLKRLNRKGIDIIIYSNKPDHLLQELVKKKFKGIKFLAVMGKDPNYAPKPDVTLLKKVLNEHNLKPSEGLYIGDSYVDFQTSINAQMDMCYCTYGYGDEENLRKIYAHFIHDFSEVLTYIQ